ncbi:molybdenum cofactor guanylyltransferase MobA [Glaciimonas sp. CA11.2]|uniref:molybdenum cofactor guanylyltransferase MobA n=1 Tax=Glaciimonas sp. CA11.2 TaxID=3048601 RepID=UPI002AB428BA|nr:molybdenum cofactor guanylyltransferase MobA [Glaciimonas sp. CA11.2]MDY7544972.1 molybdenum cofactor guanylyltransferase MobA [Glaciimonas sp. CA11.2]MEB0163624.1 molybdenum cofactor guanylyltransferase MobA [Glaciimonas sp. CA11.2]
MHISQITGLILAGGRGSRMGGVDKGLQTVSDVPMVAHVIATLAPQVGSLMISANRNLSAYATFGVPVWPDANNDFAGPLAGIQAGLKNCQTPYLVTAPCDSPFLPDNVVSELAKALENTAADIAVAATSGINSKIQPQPVFMLMQTTVLIDLTAFIDEGGRKIEIWYRRLHYTEVLFQDATPFRNINTPNELREADNHQ